ncbi:UNVERIFIED_CONTAM: hypothetical protein Slati_3706900 [Sesamum latifolium]|uniref:Uncharacterized protein n=1 Tax=Sesamum latifolium TaxID=2727402 RepID=A0AAW2U3I4_9LAMI
MARRGCRSTLRPSPCPLCRRSKLPLLLWRRVPIRTEVMRRRWIGRQRMVFDAVGRAFWSSNYKQDGDPDDDRLNDIVHAIEQPLWSCCTQSQLGVVTELVDIKDDIDLDYCKFCGKARYKPTRERNLNRKKTPYAILRYIPLTPPCRGCNYASEVLAEQMMWHANHQMDEGSMCHPSYVEAWRHFDRIYPDFAVEPRNVRLGLRMHRFSLQEHGDPWPFESEISHRCLLGAADRRVVEFVARGCTDALQCKERDIHDVPR